MGPEGMKRRLYVVIEQLEKQEAEVKRLAEDQMCKPEELRTRDGSYLMIPILTAQAQALAALQSLQASEKKR